MPGHLAMPDYNTYKAAQHPGQLSREEWRKCYGWAYNLYEETRPENAEKDPKAIITDEFMACYVFFCDLQWSPGYDRDFIITQGDAQVTQMEKANVAKAGAEAK